MVAKPRRYAARPIGSRPAGFEHTSIKSRGGLRDLDRGHLVPIKVNRSCRSDDAVGVTLRRHILQRSYKYRSADALVSRLLIYSGRPEKTARRGIVSRKS